MIYLDCPFSDKEECKSYGGKWDSEKKKWYIPDGINSSQFKKWIIDEKETVISEHNKIEKIIELSPSTLDFQVNKCHRCFYLSKKLNIQTNNFPPPVFNKLDLIQKDFFMDKDTSFISSNLPKGRFLNADELPNKVSSSTLKDNKNRDFKLVGIPDLVIKFDTMGFGIIDFKTTKISDQKAEFYKFQLEAYATIFENPGEINSNKTPLLKPVTKLAILQFDPNKIENKNNSTCNISFNLGYVELEKRISNILFDRVTVALDILLLDKPPPINISCNDCKFFKDQLSITR
jgi:hypothetical protein